jgi:hypothetical protein
LKLSYLGSGKRTELALVLSFAVLGVLREEVTEEDIAEVVSAARTCSTARGCTPP